MKLLRRHSPQRGASLIEAAIVIPLWIILFFGIVELFFLVRTYFQMSNAAREGLNSASSVIIPVYDMTDADLDSAYGHGLTVSNILGVCSTVNLVSPPTSMPPSHPPGADRYCGTIVVHQHIRRLLGVENKAARIDRSTLQITTSHIPPCSGHKICSALNVNLQARYQGFFPLFHNYLLNVSVSGPGNATNAHP